MRARYILCCSVLGFLLGRCTSPTNVAGGSTTTENEKTISIAACIVNEADVPAANAAVQLRPADYLAVVPTHGLRKRAVYTANDTNDAEGWFVIDSVSPGEYRIEVTDRESTTVLLTCVVDETVDSVIDLGTAVMQRFATLSGVVQTTGSLPAASVGVYGLERRVAVDSATGAWRVDDLPAGDFRLRIEPESDEYGAAVIDAPYVSAGDSASLDTTVLMSYADEDYAAWAHSRSIRINTTPSGADITDDVYTFPLLVRLDTTAINFAQAAPDGRDIRFSKSDGTPLRYEIDFWNTDSSRAGVWVLMDTVRGNDSTQSITMHWGGPAGAPDFSSPSAVFNTANGHAMVWHVNETPARDLSVIRDATENRVDGRLNPLGAAGRSSGIIGNAIGLGNPTPDPNHDPDPDRIDTIHINESRSPAIAFRQNSFTISLWAKKNKGSSFLLSTPGYTFQAHRAGYNEFFTLVNPSDAKHSTTKFDSLINYFSWNHYGVVVDRSKETVSLYCNGNLMEIDTIPAYIGSLKGGDVYCLMGKYDEILDEIRLSRSGRNEAWMKLTYESQRRDSPVLLFR